MASAILAHCNLSDDPLLTRSAIVVYGHNNTPKGIFQDRGTSYQGIPRPNVIEGKTGKMKLCRTQAQIPLHPHVSESDVLRILTRLPMVDLATNPGGQFPWHFGDYVLRFLRELQKEGWLILDVRDVDHLYEMEFKPYLPQPSAGHAHWTPPFV